MVTLRPLLTETDSPSKFTTVRITGPPIKHAKPVLSAFEVSHVTIVVRENRVPTSQWVLFLARTNVIVCPLANGKM